MGVLIENGKAGRGFGFAPRWAVPGENFAWFQNRRLVRRPSVDANPSGIDPLAPIFIGGVLIAGDEIFEEGGSSCD
jgi:hypothetical protein